MTPLPRQADGNSPLVQTVNQIISCLRERELRDSQDILAERGPDGVRAILRNSMLLSSSNNNNAPRWA